MGFKWYSVARNVLILITKLKIFGVHFLYNKILEQDKNFCKHIVKIENVLKLWFMRRLTLEGRIMVFKSLAASKEARGKRLFLNLLLITKFHNMFCLKYRKTLFGNGKRQKVNTELFAMAMKRVV